MKSINLTGLALIMGLGSNLASALPCDGFQLKVRNNLADNLVVTSIKLANAELAPNGIQKIDQKTEQVFTVNNSAENGAMAGQFDFHTLSLPSKKVTIKYTLENGLGVCHYNEVALEGDYKVDTTRLLNQETFTINNG